MSGIVGLWNRDGRLLHAGLLAQMAATLRHRGPDGEGTRVDGSIGFACQHLWATREDYGDKQPLVRRSGVMLVMDGRIDNRDELVRDLDLAADISDAGCVLAAYDAWRERGAERLNGDFAAAIFDPRSQQLLLVRDSIGIRPLYYFHSERLFAFASEIKALLAHPDIPARADEEGIADYMLVSSRPIDRPEMTCFAGISALAPAHLAVVTPDRVVTRRYWDFDTGRAIRFRSFDEYTEAFRDRFKTAVRRRIRSIYPVAVSVSGGLDSSSIFCQAQALLRSARSNCPGVVGISHSGARGTDGDESEYVGAIEREYGVTIDSVAIEPLAGVVRMAEEQIHAVEAPLLDYMWGVTREVHRRATARGTRVLLTGHWGDQVFFSSAYLSDLFHNRAIAEIGRHLREYLNWLGASETRALGQRLVVDIVRHHTPRALLPLLKRVRRRLFRVERPKPWFSDDFLRRALRFADRPATIGEGFHSTHARGIYVEARSKYHVHCMECQNKLAAVDGLDVAFPVLDRDLLAFLMAIPGDIQNRNGVPRALLREAMRDILPEAIRTRKTKGDFSYIVNTGVERDVGAIAQALSSDSTAVRLRYLDRNRLAPAVTRLSRGLTRPDCLDSWDLADLFGLEVWLQVFLSPRGSRGPWAPHSLQENIG